MNYSTSELMRDIYVFLKPYKLKFTLATFLRVISDIVWLYPAYALASLVNFYTTYKPGDSLNEVVLIVSLFAAAIFVRYVAQNFAKRLMFFVSEQMSLDAQVAGISHMFKIDIAWHEGENTGNKLKKIVRGGESLVNLAAKH